MDRWGFWDWLGYAVLGVAAVIETLNTSLASAPKLSAMLPKLLTGDLIHYAPLAFFALATVILVLRALGWLPGKRDTQSMVGHLAPATAAESNADPILPNAQKEAAPPNRPFHLLAPIVDVEIGVSRLTQAAPWLEFYCAGFNATGHTLHLDAAKGRVRIGGAVLSSPELS